LDKENIISRHSWSNDEILRCVECSWQIGSGDYLKTFQHKQLSAVGATEFFTAYIASYEHARSSNEKMLAIDRVIHEFHYSALRQPTRATCVNLIEGTLSKVIRFLDGLSYGDGRAPDLDETRSTWRTKLNSIGNVVGAADTVQEL